MSAMELLEQYSEMYQTPIKYTFLRPLNQKLYLPQEDQYVTIHGIDYLLSAKIKNAHLLLRAYGIAYEGAANQMKDYIKEAENIDILNRTIVPDICMDMYQVYLNYTMDCLYFTVSDLGIKTFKMKPIVEGLEKINEKAYQSFKEIEIYFKEKTKDLDKKTELYYRELNKVPNTTSEENKKVAKDNQIQRSELIVGACLDELEKRYVKVIERFYNYILSYFDQSDIFCEQTLTHLNVQWHPFDKELWLPILKDIPMKDWENLEILFNYYDVDIKDDLEILIVKSAVEHYHTHHNYNFPAKLIMLYRYLDGVNLYKNIEVKGKEGLVQHSDDSLENDYVDVAQRETMQLAFVKYFEKQINDLIVNKKYRDMAKYFSLFDEIIDETNKCPFLKEEDKQNYLCLIEEKFKQQKPKGWF